VKPVAPGSSFGERTPAAGHDLDLVSAGANDLARDATRFLGAVDHGKGALGVVDADVDPAGHGRVAVTAGLGEAATAIRSLGPGKRPRSMAIFTPRGVRRRRERW